MDNLQKGFKFDFRNLVKLLTLTTVSCSDSFVRSQDFQKKGTNKGSLLAAMNKEKLSRIPPWDTAEYAMDFSPPDWLYSSRRRTKNWSLFQIMINY